MRDLGRAGEGILPSDRGVIFVPGALPGERIRVGPPRKQGKVLRAPLLRVLEASLGRVEPPCALAERCGGCPLMHASEALEGSLKEGLLRAALGPLWPEPRPLPLRALPPRLGYRRRARLAFRVSPSGGQLGYRRPRSRAVLDVPTCPVLRPELERALSLCRARLLPLLEGEGELRLALGEGGGPVLALRSPSPQPTGLYAEVRALIEEGAFCGIALSVGGARGYALFGDPRERSVGADGLPMGGTIDGFSQAHEAVNEALVRAVLELGEPAGAEVLELFSGAGNLSVALARVAASLTAVELHEGSLEALRANLEARSLGGVRIRPGDALMAPIEGRPELVVLDPPRTGARELMPRLARSGAARILYVSCEPSTLARDLRILCEGPYALTRLEAFDMFPQTAHMETVARLDLRPG